MPSPHPLSLSLLLLLLCCCVPLSQALTKVLVPAVFRDWDEAMPRWAKDAVLMKQHNYSVFLYQKKDPNRPHYLKNRGTEGGVYLRYIVDHYHHFPDVAIFVHGRPEHHQPHWLEYIGCISPNATYINFNFDYHIRNTHYWANLGNTSIWIEQCFRDVLKIVWDLEDKPEEFNRRVPAQQPIWFSFSCCQQFIISRAMVHRRPLSVWKKLLRVINEQDACHLGEPDYEQLHEYKKNPVKVGPEPAFIARTKDGVGRYTQGVAMEHLAHVIFGHYGLDMDYPDDKFICQNFLAGCPSSPCDPDKKKNPKK